MARRVFLDYCWHLLSCQLGYAFSSPHTVAYSIEAVQEANLATRFNPLFWQCACLSVNAGSSVTSMEEDFGGAETEAAETEVKTITANYGKITRAIVQAQNSGVNIELPDVNKAEGDFVPDVKNNAIVFSLQSVSGVNAELVNAIMANRPYVSLEDFVTKVSPSRQQMFSLLKAGAFDALYPGKTRVFIVNKYLQQLAEMAVCVRGKFTMANFPLLEKLGLLPHELDIPRRVLRYKKWEEANEYEKAEKRYKISHPSAVTFFESYFLPLLQIADYSTIPGGYSVTRKVFNKIANYYINQIKEWLNTGGLAEEVCRAERDVYVQDLLDKYFVGSVSQWEMETLHFYHARHELSTINVTKYGIVDFEDLPEHPPVVGYTIGRDNVERPVYAVHNICGTVVDVDNNKHLVTLLTNHNKIVDVKFYRERFNNFNKKISTTNDAGKKTVVDDSWFTKGRLLMIAGFRRENSFVPRADWDKGIHNPVRLISSIGYGGEVTLITKREETK